jgi:hypothetical protein
VYLHVCRQLELRFTIESNCKSIKGLDKTLEQTCESDPSIQLVHRFHTGFFYLSPLTTEAPAVYSHGRTFVLNNRTVPQVQPHIDQTQVYSGPIPECKHQNDADADVLSKRQYYVYHNIVPLS